MGNSLGSRARKKVKVMKISGETMKLKTPVQAGDIVKDYPGHVLLDSDSVKQVGVRAVPLDHHQPLKPKKLYFLVELPKVTHLDNNNLNKINDNDVRALVAPRRVQSGIHMTAKDRLECLMLSRRSASDLPISRTAPRAALTDVGPSSPGASSMRVKMRLTRAQMDKLVEESKDQTEVAEKVLGLYMMEKVTTTYSGEVGGSRGPEKPQLEDRRLGSTSVEGLKAHEKRVRFTPMERAIHY